MENLFARLEHEHDAIRDALRAFAQFLVQAQRNEADPTDLPRFAIFFREYVDLIHHEREERLLLPALVRHDFSPTAGPLRYVRDQHTRERELLQTLVGEVFRRGGCPPTDPALLRAAEEFVAFQHTHLEQEQLHLYPVARQLLRNDTSRLAKELAQFDVEHEAYGRSVWLERVLGELVTVYGSTG